MYLKQLHEIKKLVFIFHLNSLTETWSWALFLKDCLFRGLDLGLPGPAQVSLWLTDPGSAWPLWTASIARADGPVAERDRVEPGGARTDSARTCVTGGGVAVEEQVAQDGEGWERGPAEDDGQIGWEVQEQSQGNWNHSREVRGPRVEKGGKGGQGDDRITQRGGGTGRRGRRGWH